jgi:hypothetical protein
MQQRYILSETGDSSFLSLKMFALPHRIDKGMADILIQLCHALT